MKATLLFLGGVGMQELLVIGLFVLIFFGAKKIPDFMKGLGKGVREFKSGLNDVKRDFEEAGEEPKKVDEAKK
ncbi:twin-arginine translocase TatA/TatE family subunit [Fulvivirgaceae bacterium PWU4]|jgi:sec-independent protein translocase protein TatA|uniref:Sec-independent protein translocase protein TatA n=1 Tax=Chryseosolibacter histidini TaxID=2782349 RepID=A0AAP2GM17_9BACT|nr:twin-arginine translocase TatA/TatE family subunit [Chryseosolibacter histidini]MBT1696443.1 twin-arginine translocase TatA/TatE family subunit [Chryseosolibacter histidini]